MIARVLLIDGDDGTRQLHTEFLRSAGFDVIAVSDAHVAIAFTLASQIDVVVTDTKPHGIIDGMDVARRLRGAGGTRRVPIVVLTAADDDEGRAKARAVGCSVILERRCQPAALASEIRRLVAERPGEGAARRSGTAHRATR